MVEHAQYSSNADDDLNKCAFCNMREFRTSSSCKHNVLGVQNQNHNVLTIIEMQLAVGAQMQQNFMTESKHLLRNLGPPTLKNWQHQQMMKPLTTSITDT